MSETNDLCDICGSEKFGDECRICIAEANEKPKPKRKKPYKELWTTAATLMLFIEGKDKRLAITCSPQSPTNPKSWVALGVETSINNIELDEIVAQHGHKILVTKATMPEAIEAANAYAEEWKQGNAPIAECDCEDIQLPLPSLPE